MTTIKYDNSDIESGGGGKEPDPGLYPGKIVSVTHRTKKADGKTPANDLEVIVDIGQEYVRLWTYIQLPGSASYDNSRWKLREFTDALGLPPKGALDPKKLEGKPVMVKTKMRRDDPDRAEVKNLFKPGDEVLPEGEDVTAGTEDYNTWSVEDLEAEIQEKGLDMPSGRKTVAKLAAVLEAAGEDEGEEPEAEEEEPEGEGFDITQHEGFEDWDEWDKDDLKSYLSDNGIELEGRFSEAKAKNAIIEHVQGSGEAAGGDDGGEDAEPADDYDDWSDDELKDEIKDRAEAGAEIEVKGRWTRDKAIAAMRADDEANPF